jgi:hypothetical protein
MGQMKEFGMLVANLIYVRRLKDSEIIEELKERYPKATVGDLRKNIKAVRADPGTYINMGRRYKK